jgi:hypothetical protein
MSLAEKKEAFVELLLAGDSVDESKMDAAFRSLCPNDRLVLLVDLILGSRGTDERIVGHGPLALASSAHTHSGS